MLWVCVWRHKDTNVLEASFISYSVAVPQKSICIVRHIIREKSETNDSWIRGCTCSKVVLRRVYAAIIGVVGGTRG